MWCEMSISDMIEAIWLLSADSGWRHMDKNVLISNMMMWFIINLSLMELTAFNVN